MKIHKKKRKKPNQTFTLTTNNKTLKNNKFGPSKNPTFIKNGLKEDVHMIHEKSP